MDFLANNIRDVAVLGHQGSGKTSLVEAIYAVANNKKDKGSIEKRNTISDFTQEEKNRLTSCSLSVVNLAYQDYKINLIDIPGNDDFIYEAMSIARMVKGAILVIDASSGVQVETIKHYKLLKKRGIPTIIFVNKMDKEDVNFDNVLKDIQTKISKTCVPFCLPIGHEHTFDGFINVVDLKARKYNGVECVDDVIHDDKKEKVLELHNMITEQVALTDDALLDKFFSGETLTMDEIHKGLRKGVLNGELTPVMVGCALKNIGIHTLLNMLISYLPAPNDLKPYTCKDNQGNETIRKTDDNEPFSAYIFKTSVNPYSGVIALLKVNSGTLKLGDEVYCPNNGQTYKVNTLFFVNGEKQETTNIVHAGDLCGVSKLDDLENGFTLCDKTKIAKYEPAHLPTAVYFKSIEVRNKKDEEKINNSLAKVLKESPCVELKRNNETKQLLIGGLSDSHISYIAEKLKNTYGITVTLGDPKVVYRETIKATAEAEGRYVKQSGGSGFYGIVTMRFSPNDKNEFTEEIFGGAVPKSYFPAVEKGFYESVQQGLLAGFPVVGVKATLIDGKYHSVDSNELAFKMAAILAFKEAYMKCKPTILEPIMKITINVENQYIGNILNDLTQRRGRVLNMEELGDDTQNIIALAPESEILDYVTQLRVLTQGSGFFNREFDSFQEAPNYLIDSIIKNNSLLNK